jgi:excinuclease UvrABC nuclease subunit
LEKAPEKLLKQKEKQMNSAAKILDFETAAILRDEIKEIELFIEKKNKKEIKDEKERLKNQKKF